MTAAGIARLAQLSSEIRLVRYRDAIIEQVLIVLGANILFELLRHAPIAPHSGPRLVEGVRVLHREGCFHELVVVDHAPALDDMQLLGMRRAVGVYEGLG